MACQEALACRLDHDAGEDTSVMQGILEDDELLEHAVSKKDAADCRKWAQSQQAQQANANAKKACLERTVAKTFPSAKKAVGKARPIKGNSIKPISAGQRKKIRDKMQAGLFEVIEQLKPPTVRIVVEEAGTCLRLWHGGKRIKALS